LRIKFDKNRTTITVDGSLRSAMGECPKVTTVYSRRIVNQLWWSDSVEWCTNRKVSQKLRKLRTKTLEIFIELGRRAVKV